MEGLVLNSYYLQQQLGSRKSLTPPPPTGELGDLQVYMIILLQQGWSGLKTEHILDINII